VVALPIFFVLVSLTQSWWLLGLVESGWNSGGGNVWQALQKARSMIWVNAVLSGASGLIWAYIILWPAKRYRRQLEELAERGGQGKLEVVDQTELASLALSFNRVIEEAQKSLPKRVQAVLSSVTSGILLIDSSGKVERANPAAARLLRNEDSLLEGRGYEEAFDRSPDLVRLVARALETRASFPSEKIVITDQFGGSREVGVWLSWVRDNEENPVSLVLNLLDLTRMDSFSSGLKTAERLSLLGNVSNGIAHEIRNPLVSIRGLAQLLSTTPNMAPEKIQSYSKIMISEADRLDRVVNRLGVLAGSGTGELEPVAIREILDSVIEMTAHLARNRQVTFDLVSEDDSLLLDGRRQSLIQAVLNVVINAIEAAPEHSTVTIRSRAEDEQVLVEVENTGATLSPTELDDIFQPFHTTKAHGTGLGMTITESILQDHGGGITVRSGAGITTFTISLPCRHEVCVPSGGDARPSSAVGSPENKNLKESGRDHLAGSAN
jgi:nitrogen-specific signal transduction histidine kinase